MTASQPTHQKKSRQPLRPSKVVYFPQSIATLFTATTYDPKNPADGSQGLDSRAGSHRSIDHVIPDHLRQARIAVERGEVV